MKNLLKIVAVLLLATAGFAQTYTTVSSSALKEKSTGNLINGTVEFLPDREYGLSGSAIACCQKAVPYKFTVVSGVFSGTVPNAATTVPANGVCFSMIARDLRNNVVLGPDGYRCVKPTGATYSMDSDYAALVAAVPNSPVPIIPFDCSSVGTDYVAYKVNSDGTILCKQVAVGSNALSGDVTGTVGANVVASVGGVSATNIAIGTFLAANAQPNIGLTAKSGSGTVALAGTLGVPTDNNYPCGSSGDWVQCEPGTVTETTATANYAFVSGDKLKAKVLTNSSGGTPTLPLPGIASGIDAVWSVLVRNSNAIGGNVFTITPTSSTIDSVATMGLLPKQFAWIFSDGANYRGFRSFTDHDHSNSTNGGQLNPATALSSAVGVAQGGLGITTTPANGKIPIGNGTNYTAANITAGTNITVTNGAGSITIAASGTSSNLVFADLSTATVNLTTNGDNTLYTETVPSIPAGKCMEYIAQFAFNTAAATAHNFKEFYGGTNVHTESNDAASTTNTRQVRGIVCNQAGVQNSQYWVTTLQTSNTSSILAAAPSTSAIDSSTSQTLLFVINCNDTTAIVARRLFIAWYVQ